MSGDDVLIRAEHVSKRFCRDLHLSLRYGVRDALAEIAGGRRANGALRPGEFWCLKDVSFDLPRGEALAVIGRNGVGKSTLLRLMSGRLKLDEGRIVMRGTTALVSELGAGFNPVQTGRENVYNSAAVFGLSTAETDAVYDQIVDFAEIPEAMETPVQNYSAGMRARLGYAVVAHVQPDILLIDEVLAVGDISFRRKCLEHIVRYRKNGGTLVVVAHDLYMLQTTCTRCLILETGRLVYEGDVTEGFARYYTFMNEPLPAGAVSSAEPKPPDEPPATALPVPASTPTPGLSDAYPVAVESISIRGLSSPEVRTGEDAVIEVRYRSLKAFEHVRWGFNVHTLDNVRITTGLLGFDGELFPLNVGEGSLCCRVSRLPLVAGTYLISSGIVDVKTKAVLAQGYDTPIRFTVTSDATETGNLHLFLKSLVVFDVHRHDP